MAWAAEAGQVRPDSPMDRRGTHDQARHRRGQTSKLGPVKLGQGNGGAGLVVLIALMASSGSARADQSTEAGEQPSAAEAGDAAGSTIAGDAASNGSSGQEKDAPAVDLDRYSASGQLRYADRRQVLFIAGFGGTYKDAFFGNPKAQASLGATLRWERPVHEYLTTGLSFSFYGTKPEFLSRQPAFDASLFLKGRYPFEMGRKDRKFEAEVYLIAEIGVLIWIDTNALDFNLVGPGFSTAIAPGYLFFINRRVGLVAELGWTLSEAFFARGRSGVLLHQGLARVGAVFPF